MSKIKEIFGSLNKHSSCSCCQGGDDGHSEDQTASLSVQLPMSGAQASASQGHNHDRHGALQDGESRGGLNGDQKRELGIIIISGLLFAITLILEDQIKVSFGMGALYAIYSLPYLLCGLPILFSAFRLIRKGDIFNEFTLMCGATIAAGILGHLGEAVGVMLFYRTGEFLQELASASSRQSIRALLASKPSTANVLKNGEVTTQKVESVIPGDIIVVRAGEKIPLDGEVISGISQVDTSPLTGESLPVRIKEGSEVLAGCINKSGVLNVRVTSRFADTHMAKILEMVENASSRKSPTERFITRFARYYTPAVVGMAFLIATLPPLLGGAQWETWIYRALVLLVISCPCALLISIPLGYFGGIGAASRHGILVKGGNVLDGILRTNTVVFDKTGTLTMGSFSVTCLVPSPSATEEQLLQAAALAECESNHPIALSIMDHAKDFVRPEGLEVHEEAGLGMSAVSGGKTYLAGSGRLMQNNGIDLPEISDAGSLVHVAEDSKYLGYIVVADTIKPDSIDAVSALHAQGIKTALLSGDRKDAVQAVASSLGIDDFRAELLPAQKVEAMATIADIQTIAFVGDGINDAPSLATARVGIAMGGIGSEVAIEAADAVILNDSPAKVAELYNIARRVRTIVWQNITMALGIKALFMTLGVVGLSGLWEAIFADVGVALLAVLNSVRVMKK